MSPGRLTAGQKQDNFLVALVLRDDFPGIVRDASGQIRSRTVGVGISDRAQFGRKSPVPTHLFKMSWAFQSVISVDPEGGSVLSGNCGLPPGSHAGITALGDRTNGLCGDQGLGHQSPSRHGLHPDGFLFAKPHFAKSANQT